MMLLLLVLGGSDLFAQEEVASRFYTNKKNKLLPLGNSDTLQIDTLALLPGSFQIRDIAPETYQLYPDAGFLIWKEKPSSPDVAVSYRVLPLSFTGSMAHKRAGVIDANLAFPTFKYSGDDSLQAAQLQYKNLDYSGTYGRSLSLGNQQDVSLNSNFNLQLNGYLMDSIQIEAAVTDNNIPFQPEGNTQQIQEFDQIFIRFSKGRHRLTAGDYSLERPNNYFINFTKRVQGLMYQMDTSGHKQVENKLGISGSIAKGQYVRNIFQGTEGNQGPYKLTGNNGEQFFIVLAGSEKVYMDGQLLERGEDRDYIIDYNTAEVRFMPRQLVTKDKRIQVEFEYQDRNYLNTLLYVYDELKVGNKWEVRIHAYSNQDARNQPFSQSLSGEQKQFLAGIGDDIDLAFFNSMREDTFAANKILYRMVDTLVAGVSYDSVFVYTTHPDSARYQIGFSYVGEGMGDYSIAGTNTNGRSYSWVAPVNGVRQGNYAPFTLLITPKKHQLFGLGTTYHIDSLKKINLELGGSNYAPNLFSQRDKDQHWGGAGKISYEEQRFFGKQDSSGGQPLTWINSLNYEYVQSRFKAIAPYRDVEFARDWNLNQLEAPADEQLATFSTELRLRTKAALKYELGWYRRGNTFLAHNHKVSVHYDDGQYRAGGVISLLNSQSELLHTTYWRPSFFVEKKFKKMGDISLGARYEYEQNRLYQQPTDSLTANSFAFRILSVYLKSAEDKNASFDIMYSLRQDDSVQQDYFTRDNNSQQLDVRFTLNSIKNQQISITGAYRKLDQVIPHPENQQQSNTVLGRFEYNGRIAKGFIQPSVIYELGSGQEQKRAYTYVEVPAGQGMYMWNDYNGDGLQQANEFELGLYPDQKIYIRLLTPSNEYVSVHFVSLNHSLQLNPENLWLSKDKKPWQKLASRFSDQLSLQINNRMLASSGALVFNPFAVDFIDTNIIANLTSISNTFYFNRNSSIWGGDYTFSKNSGKTLLTYGLESMQQQMHQARMRWTFIKGLTAQIDGRYGSRSLYSAVADDERSYQVQRILAEPSLTWLLASSLRITGGYKWEKRNNDRNFGGEEALIQSANLDGRLSHRNLGTLQARGTYANIAYPHPVNTPLAFIMLDALQPGSNWLWYLNWERRISKGMEISLEYEGRKAAGTNTVHTGRMSIRAIL